MIFISEGFLIMKKIFISLTSIYILAMSAAYSIEALAAGAAAGTMKGLMPILEPIAKETLMSLIHHTKDVITGATCPAVLPLACRGIGASAQCHSEHVRSACKEMCQKEVLLQGYHIKIRYGTSGKGWDLIKCVTKGTTKEQYEEFAKEYWHWDPKSKEPLINWDQTDPYMNDPEIQQLTKTNARYLHKNIRTEIAVYNERTLEGLLQLLSYREAALLVSNVKGVALDDLKPLSAKAARRASVADIQKIQKRSETLQQARDRAAAEADELIKQIDKAINKNRVSLVYGYQ